MNDMPWMLILHITALICWCGTLVYLPVLITSLSLQTDEMSLETDLSRMVFTLILTPAALIAIVSGTLIFVQREIIANWLIVKLTFVSGLVVCHALNGWLLVKAKDMSPMNMKAACLSLVFAASIIMIIILWLVLAKPF